VLPLLIVRLPGLNAADTPTATMVSDSTAEVLPVAVPLPAYTAVMGKTPAVAKLVVRVAMPELLNVPVPIEVLPL
jgi:hypothetical protein